MLIGQSKLDAAETVFFARQLEAILSKTYDIKYPDLMARQFIPTGGEAGAGSKTVTYRQFDRTGKAKIIADNAKDLPRVDISGKEFSRPVRTAGAAYGWSIQDIRAAARAGFDLNPRRAAAARRSVEEVLDEVAAIGAPDHGIAEGFLNNSNVTVDTAAADWLAAATPDNIIDDIKGMFSGIVSDTQQTERPDTLLLPVDEWAHIATTPRSTTSDTTILEFLRRSIPGLVSIEPWYRLDTAGAGGIERAVMYRRSMDVVTQEIPSDFEQLPAQEQGLEFVVNTMATTAGTALYYPKAVRYLDGL